MEQKIKQKMDRFKNDTIYTITIVPGDELQFRSKKDRFWHYSLWLQKNYAELFDGVKELKLYPDVSFPAKIGGGKIPRIHYHGTIMFEDIHKWLLSTDIGAHHMVEIDTIKDSKEWELYCTKYLNYVSNIPEIITTESLKARPQEASPKGRTIKEYLS